MNDSLLGADLSRLPETGLIIVGLSGGADSMALTHYLMHHIDRNRICCAHVNHMLRGGEADRDEAAAAQFCSENGLRFAIFREDVRVLAKQQGIGEEACGRQLRYRCFASLVCGENDRILTAHTANDNAETILFHLAKGTGLAGLCGIPPRRENILRPLLSVTRAEIEAYCAAYQLPFVQDSSNTQMRYDRNRIRQAVVPQLCKVNPAFVETVAQLTRALRADADYIARQAEALLQEAGVPGGLSAHILARAHESVRTAALKQYFEKSGCGRISRVHIEHAQALLKRGGQLNLPGNYELHCSCDVVSVSPKKERKEWKMTVSQGANPLPCGKVLTMWAVDPRKIVDGIKFNNLLFKNSLDYDTITKALNARNRREGDAFSPVGRKHTKSVKKLFLEMKIPANKRGDIILLETANKIIFVEGSGVAEGFQVTQQTQRALLIEIQDE